MKPKKRKGPEAPFDVHIEYFGSIYSAAGSGLRATMGTRKGQVKLWDKDIND